MKKILFLVLFTIFCFSGNVLASPTNAGSRILFTTTTFKPGTSTLVKRSGAQISSINFNATASNGVFIILDALTDTTGSTAPGTNVVSEGSQSTSGNSYAIQYAPPLETQTGLYVISTNGYLTITYN